MKSSLSKQEISDQLIELNAKLQDIREAELFVAYHVMNPQKPHIPNVFEVNKIAEETSEGTDFKDYDSLCEWICERLDSIITMPLSRQVIFMEMADTISSSPRLQEFQKLAGIETSDNDSIVDALFALSETVCQSDHTLQQGDSDLFYLPKIEADIVRTVFSICNIYIDLDKKGNLTIPTSLPVPGVDPENEFGLDMDYDEYREELFDTVAQIAFLTDFHECVRPVLMIDGMSYCRPTPYTLGDFLGLVNALTCDILSRLSISWQTAYNTRQLLALLRDPSIAADHPEVIRQRRKKAIKLTQKIQDAIDDAIDNYLLEYDLPGGMGTYTNLLLPRYHDLGPGLHTELTDHEINVIKGTIFNNILYACSSNADMCFTLEDLFEPKTPVFVGYREGSMPEVPFGLNILLAALIPSTIQYLRAMTYFDEHFNMDDPINHIDESAINAISAKDRQIEDREERIKTLSDMLSAKDREIERLKREIEEQRKNNNRLARKLEEAEAPKEDNEDKEKAKLIEANAELEERLLFLKSMSESPGIPDTSGETGDMVIDILANWDRSHSEPTRRKALIGDFLQKNPSSGNLELRRERIKAICKNYEGITANFRSALNDLGFNVVFAGKHAKIYYGEDTDRYVLASLTPSDGRTGRNLAAEIIAMFT